MDTDDITFEDLLAAEPAASTAPTSFSDLRAEGFPHRGGIAELAAIARLRDPGSKFAAVQHAYRDILEQQISGVSTRAEVRVPVRST